MNKDEQELFNKLLDSPKELFDEYFAGQEKMKKLMIHRNTIDYEDIEGLYGLICKKIDSKNKLEKEIDILNSAYLKLKEVHCANSKTIE